MDKIPVNIISGFLGSGKTTAIIKLIDLKNPNEQWAVIINEFGKISIDSQTLRSSSSSAGTVFDISGGCLCCSAKGYLKENIQSIVRSGKYSRILIEPSGLGGIDMVSESIGEHHDLRLMPLMCMVDITGIENTRLQSNLIYKSQIAKAELIVFSKCDLLKNETEQERLIQKFKSSLPQKQYFLSIGVNLYSSIFDDDFYTKSLANKYSLLTSVDPNLTDSNYQEKHFVFDSNVIFDPDKLAIFFKQHQSIIRAKGHIRTENEWILINFSLSGCMFNICEAKEQNELIIILELGQQDLFQNLFSEIEQTQL